MSRTVTRRKYTTSTVTKFVTSRVRRDGGAGDGGVHLVAALEIRSPPHHLVKRHLCPLCPVGMTWESFGKTSGGSSNFCCPRCVSGSTAGPRGLQITQSHCLFSHKASDDNGNADQGDKMGPDHRRNRLQDLDSDKDGYLSLASKNCFSVHGSLDSYPFFSFRQFTSTTRTVF